MTSLPPSAMRRASHQDALVGLPSRSENERRQMRGIQSTPSSPLLSPWTAAMHRRGSLAAAIPSLSIDEPHGSGTQGEQPRQPPPLSATRRSSALGSTSRTPSQRSDPNEGRLHAPSEKRRSAVTRIGLDLAKMRNPTLALQVTPQWTIELTYAEILQYGSIAVAAWQIYAAYAPQPQAMSHSWLAAAAPTEIDLSCHRSTSLNVVVFVVALATLELRRRAEHLGLRRTALMLCAALFVVACAVAVTSLPSSAGCRARHGRSSSSLPASNTDTVTRPAQAEESLDVRLCRGNDSERECRKLSKGAGEDEEGRLHSMAMQVFASGDRDESQVTAIHKTVDKLCTASAEGDPDRPVMVRIELSAVRGPRQHSVFIACNDNKP